MTSKIPDRKTRTSSPRRRSPQNKIGHLFKDGTTTLSYALLSATGTKDKKRISIVEKLVSKIDPVPEEYQAAELIYLSNNCLTSLNGISQFTHVQTLSVSNNKIATFHDLSELSQCRQLKKLTLQHNPVAQLPNYRLHLISICPNLLELDKDLADNSPSRPESSKVTQSRSWEIAQSDVLLAQQTAMTQRLVALDELIDSINSLPPLKSGHSYANGRSSRFEILEERESQLYQSLKDQPATHSESSDEDTLTPKQAQINHQTTTKPTKVRQNERAKELQDALDSTLEQLDSVQQQLASLQEHFEQQQENLVLAKQTNEQLQRDLHENEENRLQLTNTVQSLQRTLLQKEDQFDALKAQNTRLQDSLEKKRVEEHKTQTQLQRQTEQFQQLKKEFEENQNVLQELQNAERKSEETAATKEHLMNSLERENAELKKEIEEQRTKIDELVEDKRQILTQNDELHKVIREEQLGNHKLVQDSKEKTQTMESLQNTNDTLIKLNNQLQSKLDDSEKRLNDVESQLLKSNDQIRKLEEECQALQSEKTNLEQMVKTRESEMEKSTISFEESIKTEKEALDGARNENKLLLIQLENQKETIELLETAKTELTHQLNESRQTIEEKNEQISRSDAELSTQLESSKQSEHTLNQQLEAQQETIENQNSLNAQMKSEIASLENELSTTKSELEAARTKLNRSSIAKSHSQKVRSFRERRQQLEWGFLRWRTHVLLREVEKLQDIHIQSRTGVVPTHNPSEYQIHEHRAPIEDSMFLPGLETTPFNNDIIVVLQRQTAELERTKSENNELRLSVSQVEKQICETEKRVQELELCLESNQQRIEQSEAERVMLEEEILEREARLDEERLRWMVEKKELEEQIREREEQIVLEADEQEEEATQLKTMQIRSFEDVMQLNRANQSLKEQLKEKEMIQKELEKEVKEKEVEIALLQTERQAAEETRCVLENELLKVGDELLATTQKAETREESERNLRSILTEKEKVVAILSTQLNALHSGLNTSQRHTAESETVEPLPTTPTRKGRSIPISTSPHPDRHTLHSDSQAPQPLGHTLPSLHTTLTSTQLYPSTPPDGLAPLSERFQRIASKILSERQRERSPHFTRTLQPQQKPSFTPKHSSPPRSAYAARLTINFSGLHQTSDLYSSQIDSLVSHKFP
ncbi:hypothetical protein BLNAU_2652 [Blattamonas nauphoetae]|uniref:Uncharacterized protein n=1 Tax=Blattamonas nauphoetae TaxID=2049346 RepID=A0ABQ9YFB5_9EUKA|nr:hypothetical protein BLNAU_2652 [Blattamonas nauphoetae]